ncbi:iron-siderophore ABC transporter substrate-binding protein [Leucobacter sp. wl10]|uniref:ABC transporter substrate-binding protein n=1 Tax=Leucobacter sp. wl10 TaxID=2304677 RepID=UPI0013C2B003|nr:iron-siderophore ABC transporter substrate-binding protein [Leucobacter sp. wl10]
MQLRRKLMAGAAAAVIATALTGCGTTEAAVEPANEAPAGQAITVLDYQGQEVTLENGPAKRVVALEWEQAEIFTSLGIDLVGVADVAGYTSWAGNSVPLSGKPADVGTRGEPSVEAIAELEPDLIVGSASSVPDAVRGQLDRVAPILLLGASATGTDDGPLERMKYVVDTFAKTVDRADEGKKLFGDFSDKLDANARRIAKAGAAGTPATFTSIYESGGSIVFRLEGEGSLTQGVLDRLGLQAAYTGKVEEYGLASSDIEGLTEFPDDAWLFYWANADSDDPVATQLKGNGVWDGLPMVQADRVRGVADGVWLYGGPVSLGLFSDEIANVMTAR